MATRSTIKIEGINFAKVYKHWDGYPDGMVDWLTEFNKDFTANRDEAEYKFAQLLRYSGQMEVKSRGKKMPSYENEKYTGWGVVPYQEHCGAEYEYELKADGTVSYTKV